ncbi:MAG: sulfatase [Planctomycetota bacterium]|nr:sulfatase [Planctomycetota bacterium]
MMNRLLVITAVITFFANDLWAESRPNVIFFAVDDLCDWVGAMGHDQAITPNMDSLARQGVLFTGAHAPGVYCAPSRSAIFTGQYASTTGCYGTEVYHYDHPELVPLQLAFQRSGYGTFGAGKLFHHREGYLDHRGWDNFFVRNETLKRKGWRIETWPMAVAERDVPFPEPFPASVYNRGKQVTGGLFLEWGAIPKECEEAMADTRRVNYACDVLKQEHQKPFFLAVGLYSPHFPNYAPQKYFDLYDADQIKAPPYKLDDLEDLPAKIRKKKENRRRQHHEKLVSMDAVEDAIHGYLACVSYADAMLGRVLKALCSSPHADNTIVVLWSDHGYHHGEKGDWGKHTLWERTSNVPLIWSGPGIAVDARVGTTVSLIDMYPTLVDLCRLQPVQDLEGESLAKVLGDPSTAEDRDVFLPDHDPGGYAMVNQDWRLIHYSDGTEEFYDVRADPHEWHNLAADQKFQVVKQRLRSCAPDSFSPPATPKNQLRLVIEGTTFRWEPKPKP